MRFDAARGLLAAHGHTSGNSFGYRRRRCRSAGQAPWLDGAPQERRAAWLGGALPKRAPWLGDALPRRPPWLGEPLSRRAAWLAGVPLARRAAWLVPPG